MTRKKAPRQSGPAKRAGAIRDLWDPAVNNVAAWGRRAFVEIADPWAAEGAIRGALHEGTTA